MKVGLGVTGLVRSHGNFGSDGIGTVASAGYQQPRRYSSCISGWRFLGSSNGVRLVDYFARWGFELYVPEEPGRRVSAFYN